MGTVDYCIIVSAVFFILLVLAIRQDEKRKGERRGVEGLRPDGIERRRVQERRDRTLGAYVLWALRALGAKIWKRS